MQYDKSGILYQYYGNIGLQEGYFWSASRCHNHIKCSACKLLSSYARVLFSNQEAGIIRKILFQYEPGNFMNDLSQHSFRRFDWTDIMDITAMFLQSLRYIIDGAGPCSPI